MKTKDKVSLEFSDIKPSMVFREKDNLSWLRAISVSTDCICFSKNGERLHTISYDDLMENFEVSEDLKEWKGCWKYDR